MCERAFPGQFRISAHSTATEIYLNHSHGCTLMGMEGLSELLIVLHI